MFRLFSQATRIYSHKQQGDIALKLQVASFCFKCFIGMLQVFYIDIVEVDREVAHIAMVFSSICPKCFVCFRCMLQVFHLDVAKVDLDITYTCMLQIYISSVSAVLYVCCKCFIWMLHMFGNGYKHVFLMFQT
jgi:hypothetical protein